jgi:hypothetical protein
MNRYLLFRTQLIARNTATHGAVGYLLVVSRIGVRFELQQQATDVAAAAIGGAVKR